MRTSLWSKVKAAYEHGKMDFHAGYPFDPNTPLVVYGNLGEPEKEAVMRSWTDGWQNECVMQSLPDGMPA